MLSAFARIADLIENDWRTIARPNQIAPAGDWFGWLILAGRGWGKTRTGAEWVREQVEAGARRIALVGPTAADTRDVMVEGESGLLAISHASNRPEYEPSKRRLTWPNGAVATLYSSEEPERLRGPQHDAAWCDELGAWRNRESTWDQLMFGLRLGQPRVVITTTPKPIKLIKDLMARPDFVVTRGSTSENSSNLARQFLDTVVGRYAGTRLGRQELEAEILEDIEGALWTRARIEDLRVVQAEVPPFRRIVVAIDPAVTANEKSDETGIIVAALGIDGHGYVLGDHSGKYLPAEWAREAVKQYHRRGADRIIGEVNQGGAMVEATVRAVDENVPFKGVHASRGKIVRAEPISALYEQGRVHHVGAFPELEDQLCTFAPGSTSSPDRLDALVWALTELMGTPDGTAIIEFYRREVEENKTLSDPYGWSMPSGEVTKSVRLIVPPGTSHVIGISGVAYLPIEGVIEVSDEDAHPLIASGFKHEEPVDG